MIIFGWGRESITVRLRDGRVLLRRYRLLHFFYFLTLPWSSEYAVMEHGADVSTAQWISKWEALALLNGRSLRLSPWRRFSLLGFVVLVVGAGVLTVSLRSKSAPEITSENRQAWLSYFDRTQSAIDQLNALEPVPLSSAVTAENLDLLKRLEGSPSPNLNKEISREIDLCRSDSDACDIAINDAGDAYNSALDEAGREGLVIVETPAPPATS